MSYILALDQSTSATKALIYDINGMLVDKVSIEHRQIYPQSGWVEHDTEEIWNNTLAALRAIVEGNGGIKEFLCLSITNQRETFVVFDKATGKPLHHAIVWQCRRGDALCAEMISGGSDEVVRRKTGLKIDSYFSASKLTWLIQSRPELGRMLAEGHACVGTIDTYLVHRLTRGKVFATDHTNASRTLLFDIARLQWDEELCRIFQVPMRALAEVRDCTADYGETDLSGLLGRPIPICGVMGDSQAALFAHRCFRPGTAKVTLGTGASVLMNIGSRTQNCGKSALTTIAWTHAGAATYCLEGIINYAAATIAWLKDQLGLIQSADETEAAALSVPDSGGVYLVPAFAGLSAPYWSPNARAAIVGMTSHSGRSHIIRAALESIAYQLRDVLDVMKAEANVELRAIHADGGATRNRFLMQFIADITGVELLVSRMPDCSSLGTAMAGALGRGAVDSLGALEIAPHEVEIFRPSMKPELVEERYTGWKRAVHQVLAGAE